jgi:hypothetical protein
MKSTFINLALLKLGWVACVFGAAAGRPGIGVAVIAVAVAVHLARSENRAGEVRLLFSAAVIGLIWETLLVSGGVLAYGDGSFQQGLAPYWIVGMWILFATTMNVGMRWLRRSPAVAAIAGAVGGPVSFLAGEKAGAVSFGDPVVSLAIIAAGWALLLPLLVSLAQTFEGNSLPAAEESA